MTVSGSARHRTLQDDLLDDLRQAPVRPAPAPAPARDGAAAEPAPAVELRITPRSWSAAGWTRRPGGDGVTISLGPVCLSLGNLRP
jgi:hypothetical protein